MIPPYSVLLHGPVVITSITKDHDYISRSGHSQRIRYSITLLPFFNGGKPQGQTQEGQYQVGQYQVGQYQVGQYQVGQIP